MSSALPPGSGPVIGKRYTAYTGAHQPGPAAAATCPTTDGVQSAHARPASAPGRSRTPPRCTGCGQLGSVPGCSSARHSGRHRGTLRRTSRRYHGLDFNDAEAARLAGIAMRDDGDRLDALDLSKSSRCTLEMCLDAPSDERAPALLLFAGARLPTARVMIMAAEATPLNHCRAPRTRPRSVQTILFERAAWLTPLRIRTHHVFGHSVIQSSNAAAVLRVKGQRRVKPGASRRRELNCRSVTSTLLKRRRDPVLLGVCVAPLERLSSGCRADLPLRNWAVFDLRN